jgi:hypothetical protein
MPRFKQFHEFVKDKDKGKAPVKQIADYPGPIKNAPPGGGKPYAAAGGKAPKSKVDSDWTDKGDKDLVYKPKTAVPGTKKCCSDHVDSVKEFVDTTKHMNPAEFAKYLARTKGNCGAIHESINATCKLLKSQPNQVEALVAEARRAGIYRQLVEFTLKQNEGLKILAEMMADRKTGESTCRSLCRAMNEMVGPPAHQMKRGSLGMGDEGHGMGDPHGGPDDMSGPHGMGGGHPHPLDHDDMDDDEFHDDDMDDDEFHDDDMDDMDDDEFHDDDDMGDMDGEGMDDQDDMGIDDEDMDGMDDPSQGAADLGPEGMSRRPGAGVGLHRPPHHGFDGPKPSMMSRMMAKENKSPALRNFLKALNS